MKIHMPGLALIPFNRHGADEAGILVAHVAHFLSRIAESVLLGYAGITIL
jgi:hypothetical protein